MALDRPNIEQPRTARSIRDLLMDPKTQGIMKNVVPRHMTPERMIRLAVIAVNKTPKLLECNAQELLGAFIGCSALGLEPNSPLQHVHLIPFYNTKQSRMEVQVIVGYRGYLDLGRRSGQMRAIHADVAMEGDEFTVEFGTDAKMRHVPLLGAGDRGKPLAAYCHVLLTDGQAFTVMPWSDVLKIRNASQNYQRSNNKGGTVWGVHELRQGRKTAIRQLFAGGEVPISLEIANAVSLDERRVDFASLVEAHPDDIKENMAGAVVDDDVDPETGEVREQPAIEDQREEPVADLPVHVDDKGGPVPVEQPKKPAAKAAKPSMFSDE